MDIAIKFDLSNTILSDNSKKYWIDGAGYDFFLEKTKDLLLLLSKNDYFEFRAYCSEPERDIVKDFDNDLFKIIDKKGLVSENGDTRLVITIKPLRFFE
ncbi:hypothetical protein [Chryseobacterium sp. WX]|uniref:hypothetical protein n=1 Tax=Chryseobacterium sp. WX TaxID=3031803 RepID=UPI002409EC83|nr:hypothetical protein [Chryseobacterium sp. WX]WFB67503.1 hypothetical protein PZ898_22795 [Chryseobacterium sp. WX]